MSDKIFVPPKGFKGLLLFLLRGLKLRCPECGISPVFLPLRRTRTWHDWVTPLTGCAKCGYFYDREAGYFLMAVWGTQYLVVAGFGLILGLLLMELIPDLRIVFIATAIPTVLAGIAFIRHAKSIYLAIDHYCDPVKSS